MSAYFMLCQSFILICCLCFAVANYQKRVIFIYIFSTCHCFPFGVENTYLPIFMCCTGLYTFDYILDKMDNILFDNAFLLFFVRLVMSIFLEYLCRVVFSLRISLDIFNHYFLHNTDIIADKRLRLCS